MAKTWTPDGSYSAYGSDYYEQGNKYGNGMEIAGASKAPKAPGQLAEMNPSEMNANQRDRWQQYQKDKKAYEGTDNYLANQNPYEYFSKVMAQSGYTPGGTSGFENWLKNEFTQMQGGYNQANFANNQLNFADYLKTFGSPQQLSQFLMTRYQSRTPDQQGMSGTSAYGGPARWSVF